MMSILPLKKNKQTHLSSLDMIMPCVWLAEVRAEKLMQLGMYL